MGGTNTYSYVLSNPVANADRYGLFVDEAGKFIQVCVQRTAQTAVAAGSLVASVIGGILLPSSTSQCDVIIPDPEANCPEDDECAKLVAQIKAHVGVMRVTYLDMLVDKHDLFHRAFMVNPGGDIAGRGTWSGHRTRYEGLIAGLKTLIDRATVKGCNVPPEAYEWLSKRPPMAPVRSMSSPTG